MTDEPEAEPDVAPERDDEGPLWWDAVMADSGSHWVQLNPRRGNQRRYPPKEQAKD